MIDVTTEAPSAQRRAIRFNPTRVRGEVVYRRAHRHSRLVNWLKVLLPLLAVIGIGGFFGAMRVMRVDNTPPVSLESINTESKSLVMNKPHISGFKGTQWAYEVHAERAIQDIKNPKIITLEKIDAQFGTGGPGRATVIAATGVLDGDANTLALSGGITMTTSDGYSATLQDAAVDIGKGNLSSSKPIEIKSKDGTLHANQVEVLDRGKKITFRNGVTMSFVPPDTSAEPDPPGAAATPTGAGAPAPKTKP